MDKARRDQLRYWLDREESFKDSLKGACLSRTELRVLLDEG